MLVLQCFFNKIVKFTLANFWSGISAGAGTRGKGGGGGDRASTQYVHSVQI